MILRSKKPIYTLIIASMLGMSTTQQANFTFVNSYTAVATAVMGFVGIGYYYYNTIHAFQVFTDELESYRRLSNAIEFFQKDSYKHFTEYYNYSLSNRNVVVKNSPLYNSLFSSLNNDIKKLEEIQKIIEKHIAAWEKTNTEQVQSLVGKARQLSTTNKNRLETSKNRLNLLMTIN